MKASKHFKVQWEEEQFLQLINFIEQFYKILFLSFKNMKVVLNVLIYIFYQCIKLVFNLIYLVLFSETIQKSIHEEHWIFRKFI